MSQSTESKSKQAKPSENRTSTNDPPRIEDHSQDNACESNLNCGRVNVGDEERIASAVGGAIVTAFGLVRSGPTGWILAALGASLLYRGTTGHCSAYKALNIDTAHNNKESRQEPQNKNISRA